MCVEMFNISFMESNIKMSTELINLMHIVIGTHTLHQVCNVGLDKILLQTQNLSCFCKFCIDGGDVPCDHVNYVSRFDLIWFVPCKLQDVKDDEIDKNNI
jgi:hypothetical protein